VKKLLTILLLAAVAAGVYAQDGEPSLKLSGEAKTGIFYEQSQQDGGDVVVEELKLHSKDDAGGGQGRFRLNLDYENGRNLGFRARLQWEEWKNTDTLWSYAFGYGNFFEDQLTVSVGKLGSSPWGTGGDMWKELEFNSQGGGMRVEWKPAFIPEEFGKINAGFVLNYFNEGQDAGADAVKVKITLMEILKESVLGISYTLDDWVLVRLAYRFDSEVDGNASREVKNGNKGGDEMLYRLEERVINNYVPGLKLWALGHLYGLSAENKEIQNFKNYFYAEYNPPELFGLETPFTAQFSVGNESAFAVAGTLGEVYLKPSFYWHFFNKLLSVGSLYRIAFDYGDGGIEGDNPYYYMEVEPKIQLNFQSSYIAFAYQFRQEYKHDYQALPGREPILQKQWINLRFCIYY